MEFSVLDVVAVGALSAAIYARERSKKKTPLDIGNQMSYQIMKKAEIKREGGSAPERVNAKEVEILDRGYLLPARSTDTRPEEHEANLDTILAETAKRARAYDPTRPGKFHDYVPGSGASAGSLLYDMYNFNFPSMRPRAPPPLDHQDF